ncbi:MAG TPA: rhamnulokinase family protein [Trebonia sp.]
MKRNAPARDGTAVVAAVDLGASGGRVIAGRVSPDGMALHEVSRFSNEPVRAGGTLHWDILRLYADVTAGLRQAAADFPLASAGIDSWAIDYGLLDDSGALIGNPVHYRDARTDGVTAGVPAEELYAVTGIQHLPFNTIYQLRAAAGTPALTAARTLLLIPDLLAYWLTGTTGAEVTNASTTALLDVSSRTWATGLMERAGIPAALFPPLRQPGDLIGVVRPAGEAGDRLTGAGGAPLPLVAVGSHDTASAVVAVPADGPGFAYISSGTWSLVGLELDTPVLSAASRAANFTNEAGVDGTVRYLRNVSGLWLLQECQRHWGTAAGPVGELLKAAARIEPLRFVIDADDPVFLPPGDMPGRIAAWLAARGRPVPDGPAEFTRCILDSLALAYRRALIDAQALSGRHADVVHVVGGGSRNDLLCQLTADATGLPVLAGPAEATALGNVLVQGRALGAVHGTLTEMRALLRACAAPRPFAPAAGQARAWEQAAVGLLPGASAGCIVSY